ncbi:MAG: hypothetical protein SFT91_02845, partial [Rickettsiaceae bacterium]|nr:hypothetical protein [Rickettsiaceae bacterium]
ISKKIYMDIDRENLLIEKIIRDRKNLTILSLSKKLDLRYGQMIQMATNIQKLGIFHIFVGEIFIFIAVVKSSIQKYNDEHSTLLRLDEETSNNGRLGFLQSYNAFVIEHLRKQKAKQIINNVVIANNRASVVHLVPKVLEVACEFLPIIKPFLKSFEIEVLPHLIHKNTAALNLQRELTTSHLAIQDEKVPIIINHPSNASESEEKEDRKLEVEPVITNPAIAQMYNLYLEPEENTLSPTNVCAKAQPAISEGQKIDTTISEALIPQTEEEISGAGYTPSLNTKKPCIKRSASETSVEDKRLENIQKDYLENMNSSGKKIDLSVLRSSSSSPYLEKISYRTDSYNSVTSQYSLFYEEIPQLNTYAIEESAEMEIIGKNT